MVTRVVFQHTSPCSYYGPEMSGRQGYLVQTLPADALSYPIILD